MLVAEIDICSKSVQFTIKIFFLQGASKCLVSVFSYTSYVDYY